MRLLISSPVPAGHVVLARLPADVAVVADLTVAEVGNVDRQDVTEFFTDLVLVGLAAQVERHADAEAGAVPPVPMVQVGRVEFDGPALALAQLPLSAFVMYAYVPGAEVREVPLDRALELAAIGVREQLTAGVAFEAAEADPLPDTPR